MAVFVHSFSSRQVLCLDQAKFNNIRDLKTYLLKDKGLPINVYFFVCNGRIVDDAELIQKDTIYHTHLRIPGGKGGFGSMLRAIGAQIEKTTNHEACRDLSGRRMRDVNNERELKEWLAKQVDREHEREQKRQERLARKRALPNHKFDDPLYEQQRVLLAENLEDAIQTGLKKSVSKPGTSSATITSEEMLATKRKSNSQEPGPSLAKKKKNTEWLGLDIEKLSDLDSDEGTSSDKEPGSSRASTSDIDESEFPQAAALKTKIGISNSSDTCSINEPCLTENVQEIAYVSEVFDTTNSTVTNIDNISCVAHSMSEEMDKTFCLDEVNSAKQLEGFGLERLKQELMDRGLKCGGTLQERAQRLFSVKDLTNAEIDPALFAKSAKGKQLKK